MVQDIRSSALLDRKVPVLKDISSFLFNVIKDLKHRVTTIKDSDTDKSK